jgi:hypothetical protein
VVRGPKTSNLDAALDYDVNRRRFGRDFACSVLSDDDARLASVFASQTLERCTFRRQVFYWRAYDQNLLPFDLPGTHFP